jgi:ankyrin repeat protein
LHSLYHAEFADLIMSVKFLLDRGANVNAQTKALETALQAACAMSH